MDIQEDTTHFTTAEWDGSPVTLAKVTPGLTRERALSHPAFAHCAGSPPGAFRINGERSAKVTRNIFVDEYGFAMLTAETLDALACLLAGQSVLEVCAGTGYLSQSLAERGVADIVASDIGGQEFSRFGFRRVLRRDHEGDSLALLPGRFNAVLMSWPHGAFGAQVLERMTAGQMLVYQGESKHGCTADNRFFELLAAAQWQPLQSASGLLNRHHLCFRGFHDSWSVYLRR